MLNQYQTQAAYTRDHKISRARVSQWIREGRLPVSRFCEHVILIDKKTPLPEKKKAGRKKHE